MTPPVVFQKPLEKDIKLPARKLKSDFIHHSDEEDDEEDFNDGDSLSIFGVMPSDAGKKSSLHSSLIGKLNNTEISFESANSSSGNNKPPELLEFE